MKYTKRLTIILFAFLGLYIYINTPTLCGNSIIKSVKSPNGKYEAVVFSRDCGATTSFNTQVTIKLANEDLPDEGGPILAIINDYSDTGILISWINNRVLKIQYRPHVKVIRSLHYWQEFTIDSQVFDK
jgi:hypothetical protein